MSKPVVTIDAAGVNSEHEFWRRYLSAAEPEDARGFGCNLDAFWDAVEGGGPGYPGDVDLHFANLSAIAGLPRGQFFREALVEIAAKASFTKITWEN